jgi:hypothetical protein
MTFDFNYRGRARLARVADPEPPNEPRSFDEWLGSFARDATLRPVLVVALGCFAAIGAGTLIAAVRSRSLAATAALVLLALGSGDLLLRDLRRRRLGAASRLTLALWALSAIAAVGAVAIGLG